MIKQSVLVLILISIKLSATQIFTVDELIEKALRFSPDINITTHRLDAAFAREDQADADYLPQVDAFGSAGAQGVKIKDIDMSTDSVLSGKLTAKQLIYDFGKTTGNIESAEYDVNASEARLQQAVSDKIFQIKEAYYSVLRTKALIDVAEENVKLNEAQLLRAQRYFEAGIRTKVDVTDAEVNLIQAKLGLNSSLYDYKHARVELEKRIGIVPAHGDYLLYADEIDFENVYEGLPMIEASIDELEKHTYLNRYEIRAYKAQINQQYARIGSAKADYYPGIYGEGSYLYQNVDTFSATQPEQQWQATVNLQWNLFAGFRTDARVQERRADFLSASSEYESIRLAAKQRTDDAYLYTLKDLDDVKLNQSLTRAAKMKYEQVEKSYQHGLSDYIELQQARQGYIDSLGGIVTAYYSYYISLADLDNAIGR